MPKLKPACLYQLRLISHGPRFYVPRHTLRYLERQNYVKPTGRSRPESRTIEYAITELGRQALEAALRE